MQQCRRARVWMRASRFPVPIRRRHECAAPSNRADRKSTRLNSSHLVISYAVFCLKKKKNVIKEIDEKDGKEEDDNTRETENGHRIIEDVQNTVNQSMQALQENVDQDINDMIYISY